MTHVPTKFKVAGRANLQLRPCNTQIPIKTALLPHYKVLNIPDGSTYGKDFVLLLDGAEIDGDDSLKAYGFKAEENVVFEVQMTQKETDITLKSSAFKVNAIKCTKDTKYDKLCEKLINVEAPNGNQAVQCFIWTDRMHVFRAANISQISVADLWFEGAPQQVFIHLLPTVLMANAYTFVSGIEFLKIDPYWQPSTTQTNISISCFLACLFALRTAVMRNDQGFPLGLLLATFRKAINFPPLILALKNLFSCGLFNFEKHLIVEVFYNYFRKILPNSIPNNQVLFHTPILFGKILKDLDPGVHEGESFVEIQLRQQNKDEMISNPVRIKGVKGKIWDKNEVLTWEPHFQQYYTKKIFTPQDLVPDILWDLFINILSQKNIEELKDAYDEWEGTATIQPEVFPVLSLDDLELEKDFLEGKVLLRFLTFKSGKSIIEKHSTQVLSVHKDNRCIYITDRLKMEQTTYHCFDPCGNITSVDSEQFMAEDLFKNLKLPTCTLIDKDSVPVQQIDMIILDSSGSMSELAFKNTQKSSLTRFDAAKASFGAFVDKMEIHELNHAVGAVSVGNRAEVLAELSLDIHQIQEKVPTVGGWTALWDGIGKGIEMVLKYALTHKQKFDVPNAKIPYRHPNLRILTLTDGRDNHSKNYTPDKIKSLCQSNGIKIDSVQLDTLDPVLTSVVHSTGGYVFCPKDVTECISCFERESVLSIARRAAPVGQTRNIGIPDFKLPGGVQAEAKSQQKAKIADTPNNTRATRLRRIMSEFKNFQVKDCHVFMSEKSFDFWKVIIPGETGTLYAGGVFLLYIEFGPDFPIKPPEIRFLTPIYHCNVSTDGKICHQQISVLWASGVTMSKVITEIRILLSEPNADDALDTEKGTLYRENLELYKKKAEDWVKLHASKSIEELKQQYKLD